eukprot:gene2022-1212_t
MTLTINNKIIAKSKNKELKERDYYDRPINTQEPMKWTVTVQINGDYAHQPICE